MMPAAPDAPPAWGVDFWIDDVERAVDDVRRLGGSVLAGPYDAPPAFSQAVVADPGGAVLSLSQLEVRRLGSRSASARTDGGTSMPARRSGAASGASYAWCTGTTPAQAGPGDVVVLVLGPAGGDLQRPVVERQRQHQGRGELGLGRPADLGAPAGDQRLGDQVEEPLLVVGHRWCSGRRRRPSGSGWRTRTRCAPRPARRTP